MAVSLASKSTSQIARSPAENASIQAPRANQLGWLSRAWQRNVSFWPLFLAPALLLPGLASFPYPAAEASYSDLVISHYPAAVYLLRALREWQTIPLWSPAILGGYPFLADPLSGLWYPPGWLALLFSLPMGFNLILACHLLWGGIGAYRLLRLEGLSHPAGLVGGLAFSAMPKMFAHYGAGHLTLLYAIAWTPWLLWAALRAIKRGEERQAPGAAQRVFWLTGLLPAVFFALILLADVRWGMYAGVLWWVYSFAHSQIGETAKRFSEALRRIIRVGAGLFYQSLLALMLAAPLLVPFVEYTLLSTRAWMQAADVLVFSLPPARLLALLFPHLGGFHEWVLYPGSLILALGVWSLLAAKIQAGGKALAPRFWVWTAICTMLFSLGSNLPLLPALAGLPGLNLLRVPPRALFIFGLALAALSAHGLENWLAQPTEWHRRHARLGLISLVGLVLALASGVWVLTGRLTLDLLWGLLAITLAAGWLLARTIFIEKMPQLAWFLGALILLSVDLAGVNLQAFRSRETHSVLQEGAQLADYLQAESVPFRVYSPSYSLPQQTAALAGLELADGIDPLQLRAYADTMTIASGIPSIGYSVTLPDFSRGTPASANQDFRPNPQLLGQLNVRYILAEYDLPVAGLDFVARFGNTRLYENQRALPRAWVQTSSGFRSIDWLNWEPNQLLIQARGPGTLVIAENSYPGWHAWIDSQPVALGEYEGLLRAVELPPGEHQVRLAFRPLSLYLGLGLCLLALGWLAYQRVLT